MATKLWSILLPCTASAETACRSPTLDFYAALLGRPIRLRGGLLTDRSAVFASSLVDQWLILAPLASLKVRRLQVFLIFHRCPVQTRFIQSKHRIDWDESPPHGHVSSRAETGDARAIQAKDSDAMIRTLRCNLIIGYLPNEYASA